MSNDSRVNRQEYLQSLMDQQDATNLLVAGARLIEQGGEEGIREAAEQFPEVIIATISGMADAIEQMQTQYIKLAVGWLDAMDEVIEVRRAHIKFLQELRDRIK